VTVTTAGRTRVYALDSDGLAPINALLESLALVERSAVKPLIGAHQLDALELEVRRTVRDHRSTVNREEIA
jgi:hypothetical protein